MKSLLFNNYDVKNTQSSGFINDLKAMLSLEKEQLFKIIQVLPEIINKKMKFSRKAAINELVTQIKIPFTVIDSSADVLEFFFSQLLDPDFSTDTPTLWADDLSEAEIISEKDKSLFIDAINMMKTDLFGSLQKERLEKISKRGVLPCFQNISTTVEVRSVVEKDYNLEKPASEYEPKIISRIPIISIDIRTDSGNDQHLYFQASIEEASAIIQELLASIKIAEKTMAKK